MGRRVPCCLNLEYNSKIESHTSILNKEFLLMGNFESLFLVQIEDGMAPVEIEEIKDVVNFVTLEKFFVTISKNNFMFLYSGRHKIAQINCYEQIKR